MLVERGQFLTSSPLRERTEVRVITLARVFGNHEAHRDVMRSIATSVMRYASRRIDVLTEGRREARFRPKRLVEKHSLSREQPRGEESG